MRFYQHIGYYCVFGAVILMFIGCAGTSTKITTDIEAGKNSEGIEEMDESFDPFTLGDYDLNVQDIKQEETDDLNYSFLAAAETDTTSLPTEVSGYRVQIFTGTDQEVVNAVRRDAILRFEENVYLIFDNPNYKVRVGDCLSRFEADDLQIKAEQKGYLDAWVVRTNITVKKSEKTEQQ